MTEQAEFEEKTYEKYFGQEIARRTRVTFSPGQVEEKQLGFDEAFLVPWSIYFFHLRHLMHQAWERPAGVKLPDLDGIADEIGAKLPPFRFNLFVQYKRPEYVIGHRSTEWKHWGRPYFRYTLTAHQQAALNRLKSASGDRAEVVYASPAFWTREALFQHAKARRVVSESNIAPVSSMVGHDRFTYITPGGAGVAHSELESISGPSIESILSGGMEQEPAPFREHLIKTAAAIEASLADDAGGRQLMDQSRQAILASIGAGGDADAASGIVNALTTIEAFSDAFGVSVKCMG